MDESALAVKAPRPLDAADDALDEVEEAAAATARAFDSRRPRFPAEMGDALIVMGRKLPGCLDEGQRARVERTKAGGEAEAAPFLTYRAPRRS